MKSKVAMYEHAEEIIPLLPLHFFSLECNCLAYAGKSLQFLPRKYLLPDFSELADQESFAEVALGWSNEGLHCSVEVGSKLQQVVYPDFRKGDCFELFIDTRDVKSLNYNSRFCHHFVFLPEPVTLEGEGPPLQAREVTRFRAEESHPLADPEYLQVKVVSSTRGYKMAIFIETVALVGYNPAEFGRMGFSYQVNRQGGKSQVFAASERDFSIEVQPSLWATLQLVK